MFPIVRKTQTAISRDMRGLEMTANNLANSESPGFKKIQASFERKGDEIAMNSFRRQQAGIIKNDGDPYHIAILGDGYFRVQSEQGEMLRRGGDFMLDPNGRLVTTTGDVLLGEGGEIVLQGTPEIMGDGTILVDGLPIDILRVVVPEDLNGLEDAGNGNFIYNGGFADAIDSRLVQGALEGSNTKGVEEMTQLIELTRASDIASRIFRTGSEILKMASSELGKVE